MAAARHSLRLPMRMKSPQLLLATIAVSSSSWSSSIQLVESFSHYYHTQKRSKSFRFECAHHRFVHLPASSLSDDASAEGSSNHQSMTGSIYEMDDVPTVKLFTKKGCTLCDKVKDVLESVKEEHPHSLYAVDITDDDNKDWFARYKYDIPVLHMNDIYWTKHRLSTEDAIAGIEETNSGDFTARDGEPDASRLEHN